jgi:hypothetical protein
MSNPKMQIRVTHDLREHGDLVVIRYWSVYEDRWKVASDQCEIPDREMAAMSQSDRDKIDKHLPRRYSWRDL